MRDAAAYASVLHPVFFFVFVVVVVVVSQLVPTQCRLGPIRAK